MADGTLCMKCNTYISKELVTFFPAAGYLCPPCAHKAKLLFQEEFKEKQTKDGSTAKDTNPKDAVGIKKWRQFSTVPFTIVWELGVAMLEGARKYGRHNYRASGVRASVYVDSAMGHISQWWEGEDIDKDSSLNHITKAMSSLAVLRDGMINETYVDDRPPKVLLGKQRKELQKAVEAIFEKYPEVEEPYTEKNKGERWQEQSSA